MKSYHWKKTLASILCLVFLIALGFPQKSITGKTEPTKYREVGLLPDPYELAKSIPIYTPQIPVENLPSAIDLSETFPPPKDQGKQKGNVGYTVGYGLISYLEAQKKKIGNLKSLSPNNIENQKIFYSPNYIYSQLNSGKDIGASLLEALVLAQSRGSVPLELMPESEGFRSRPRATVIEQGRKVKIQRIFKLYQIAQVKQALAEKKPILTSILIPKEWLDLKTETIVESVSSEWEGAQSVVILGYHDKKKAFLLWNSWGNDWGDKGYLWISYELFSKLCLSMYVVEAQPNLNLWTKRTLAERLKTWAWQEELLPLPPKEILVSRGDFADRVRITWSEIKRAIGYEVYRRRKTETKFQLIGLAKSNRFDDFGVQSGLVYQYRIVSLMEDQTSIPSEPSGDGYAFETPKKNAIPSVLNLSAYAASSNDRILLSWDKNPTPTLYSVFKWNSSSKIFRFLGKTENSLYQDLKAQRNGDTEMYQVIPEKDGISGEPSYYTSAYLSPSEIFQRKPMQFNASKGTLTGTTKLSWEGSAHTKQYLIYRRDNSEWKWIGSTDKETFYDNESPISGAYYTVIAEYDNDELSVPAIPDFGFPTTIVARNLEIPSLTVEERLKTNEIYFEWTKVQKSDSYRLYIRSLGETNWNLITETKKTSFLLSNLPKNQFYFFQVRIVMGGKESINSEPQVGVLSEPVLDLKKIRTFGETTIQKFIGPWTAMYWDGKSKVKPIKLQIEADENEGVISLRWNENEIFRGKNVLDTDSLEEKGKWRIRLSPNYDSLTGEFEDKSLLPENCRLSFVRE